MGVLVYFVPYITGYLLAGALAGPFLLDFMPSESVSKLRFVHPISLAIIAFVEFLFALTTRR